MLDGSSPEALAKLVDGELISADVRGNTDRLTSGWGVDGGPICTPARPDVSGYAELGPGTVGNDVKRLQRQLVALGAPDVKVTGKWDDATGSAIKQIQTSNGTTGTGRIDGLTADLLAQSLMFGSPFAHGAGESNARRPVVGKLDGYPAIIMARQDSSEPLGNTTNAAKFNLTIQGCVITSFAMAASKLTGQPVTPAGLNADKSNFAPGSADFNIAVSAAKHGLTHTRMDLSDPGAVDVLRKKVDAGNPVLLRVDFTRGPEGDHTVLITGRTGNTLRGIDPAGGRSVEMTIESDGSIRGAGWRYYQAVSFIAVSKVDKQKQVEE
jgi:hypothetical protein